MRAASASATATRASASPYHRRRRPRPLLVTVTMAAAATLVLAAPPCALAFRRAAPPLRQALLLPSGPLHGRAHTHARSLSSSSRSSGSGGGVDSPLGSLLGRLKGALAAVQQQGGKEEVDPGVVEGTDLRIVKYPDPRLRAPNAEVQPDEFGPELQKLAKDMFKVMYAANGVGLAAPQVGVNKRLMVFNPDGDKLKWLSEVVLVNPVIVEKSAKTDVMEEGCLSFPGMGGDVERSLTIKVSYQDAKGKAKTKRFRDWEARIFQHEYDHLDGVVYIDRLSPEGRAQVQPVLDKLIEDFGPGGAL